MDVISSVCGKRMLVTFGLVWAGRGHLKNKTTLYNQRYELGNTVLWD